MPKSMSLTQQYCGLISCGSKLGAFPVILGPSMMLEGLRSLCKTPQVWRQSTAMTISIKIYLIEYFFLLLTTCYKLNDSHYITIAGGYSPENTYSTQGMCLSYNRFRMQCYLTKLMGNPTFAMVLNRLTATSSLVELLLALQTSPYEPSAMRQRSVYLQTSLSGSIIAKNQCIIIFISNFHITHNSMICGNATQQILNQPHSKKDVQIRIYGRVLIKFISQQNMVKVAPRRQKNKRTKTLTPSFTNLEECIEQLSMDQSQLTARTAIAGIHELCKSKTKLISKIRREASEILKICRVCDKWNKAKSIITCENCDDHYHYRCYDSTQKISPGRTFICKSCLDNDQPLIKCEYCEKQILRKEEKENCKSCKYEYHRKCFSKDMQMCNRCAKLAQEVIKVNGTKKNKQNLHQLKINEMFSLIAKKAVTGNAQPSHLVEGRGLKFVAIKLLTKKDKQIELYKNQLLQEIKLKNMYYTEYLVDLNGYLADLSQSMDFGLANMSKEEQKQYLLYKSQPIGPFRFTKSAEKGVDVVADMDVPEYSIICEYIGQVLTLRKCIDLQKVHKNDSVMDLWYGKHSEKSLVICPNKWTNIARFLNGVGKRKEQKNVHSIKVCFRGKPLILLVASRKIKKGESLCYDYNGDNQTKYPTDSFV